MIDLMKFCDVDGHYCIMQKPFRFGSLVGATNGHIAVFVDDDGREADPVTHPKMLERLGVYASTTTDKWLPVSALDLPPPEPCRSCEGKGFHMVAALIDCSHCDGSGEVECDLGHDHDCSHCDGGKIAHGEKTEREECGNCDGTGEQPMQRVCVGVAHIQRKYVLLITSLPSAEIGLIDNSADPVPFRFTGGRGVVMPMRVQP